MVPNRGELTCSWQKRCLGLASAILLAYHQAMVKRREFLKGGLAALGFGLGGVRPVQQLSPSQQLSHPVRPLPPTLDSKIVDGLPYASWFQGDDFRDPSEIPFHSIFQGQLPRPSEEVDVAVIGGGISGLAAAHLLSDRRPVIFDLRARFGGNAQGESWRGTRFSLGSAYIITPDPGSFLENIYHDLGLHKVKRDSFPPDPVELQGEIQKGFWNGDGLSVEEQIAFMAYAEVVNRMANEQYPEIPLPGNPVAAAAVRALDTQTFRQNVEEQMGIPLTPILAAAIQAYFYSSFGAGIDAISAASGWNFIAAEEFGRWVFPGGNSYIAERLWSKLLHVEQSGPRDRPKMLRPNSTVVDVRRKGNRQVVTWLDKSGKAHSLRARFVVMAGSKHICKYALHNLEERDPVKYEAMQQIETMPYVIANVLLDKPVQRDFYDIFLVGDDSFPMSPHDFESDSRPVDMVNGNFALSPNQPRSVLTFYWPLPWFTARFGLLINSPWKNYARTLAGPVRSALELLEIPETDVRQIRMARWGHAVPLARPGLIADGTAEELLRPYDENVYFVNQDNWALPAVENSLLDANFVAQQIRSRL